ncbi:hypothetical protein HJFPF1_10850 [Paramyrothecium foliicola]|nr:hypothetical protein HJFPF1_10850 [Paramyrothecium foliicola]
MIFSKPIAYASMASTASAFIALTNPVPFAYDGSFTLLAPLNSDGSDFPCRGVSYEVQESNVYEAGSVQELNFKGVSVRGGGSCQVSVTTDLKPTKDSVWKVIKSIEGGCPAQGVTGNLSPDVADPFEEPVPYTYNYTVPDLAAGQYTLAWTWFNKVGNREMYMNCAPLEVTGGAGSATLESLPDMFVANAGTDCMTSEGDLLFPNPGAEVEQLNGATTAWIEPSGSECTGAAGAPVEDVPVTTTAAPVPTQTPATPEPPVEEQPTFPSPGAPCATEGNYNCVDGRSYQRCEGGAWSDLALIEDDVLSCEIGESKHLKITLIDVSPPIIEEKPSKREPVTVPDGVPLYPGVTEVFKYTANSPCPPEAEQNWNCIDGSSYQRCENGFWTAVQPLESSSFAGKGSICYAGQAVQLSTTVPSSSRFRRYRA